ncbi:MAG: ATP-dependent endonuclease [Dehalococcoidia bacterium]
MRLRRLKIERFRGILALDWQNIGDTAALVGPGDSGKSTILDAIERVLSPRWNVGFDDADFWNLDTSQPISIRATLTDLPPEFLKESKFGHAMHGFDVERGIEIAPEGTDGEALALVVELRVGETLEPVWNVVDSEGREQPIHVKDRERLGLLRVGGYVDNHLAWSRGSTLSRLTSETDSLPGVLAEVTRQARAGLKKDNLKRLEEAAAKVEALAKDVGVKPAASFCPHLDIDSMTVSAGALSLHDGDVPLRRSGLGTRRLLATAMQREAASQHGLTLIDEFEHGLEPHRIRRLLRILRGKPPADARAAGQLLLTTHSPTVLSELESQEMSVVRRDGDGKVSVARLPTESATLLARVSGALLAHKIVVCEGATEEGICIAIDHAAEANGRPNFAYQGVAIVDGGGSDQPATVAGKLVQLGYTVALFVDSDAKARASRAQGAVPLIWEGGTCTEQRLALDLPLEGFREMVTLATRSAKAKSFRSVKDTIADGLSISRATFGDDPACWVEEASSANVEEARFRQVFGASAHAKEWFKSRALGQDIGALVERYEEALKPTPSGQVLQSLRGFVFDE